MYGKAALRNKFVTDSLATASPSRLLTMLFDRLVLDIARGKQALSENHRSAAHPNFVHAQEILVALCEGLDPQWELATSTADLYQFLYRQLVTVNLSGDTKLAQDCLDIAESLRDTWHEAARMAASESAGTVPVQQTA